MARIILGSYMFRYPLGGMLSWVLQYLLGLKQLGHDVFFVEKYGYANSCYDPDKNRMSDDCSYGLKVVSALLAEFDLEGKWCFVERGERYHGLSKEAIESVFRTADLFIDMGTHGSWAEESAWNTLRVLIDGEPGYTQILMEKKLDAGETLETYDLYYTNGMNLGRANNPAPTAGRTWGHVFHPVQTSIFPTGPPPKEARFSTIMNWQSHAPVAYRDRVYGQKDMEFPRFETLPKLAGSTLVLALAGKDIPVEHLTSLGWVIKSGKKVTRTFESFRSFIASARGEFSVCKNVFVANNTGWFSDKSAAYLASGRPVVLQDTGFGKHLPTGKGLFAVKTVEGACEAIKEIESDYQQHAKAASDIAAEYLEAAKVMKGFLGEIGI